MRRVALAMLAVLAVASPGEAQEEAPRDWEAFALEALREERAASGRPWLSFLKVPSLSTGLYVLPKGGHDGQSPHERDEVYYVISGRAVLEVDGERTAVKEGAVIFVKAHVEHRFVEIEEDLEVLVFFAAPPTASTEE